MYLLIKKINLTLEFHEMKVITTKRLKQIHKILRLTDLRVHTSLVLIILRDLFNKH